MDYILFLPNELIHIISSFLDYDEIKDLSKIYNLDVNYTDILSFKYEKYYYQLIQFLRFDKSFIFTKEDLELFSLYIIITDSDFIIQGIDPFNKNTYMNFIDEKFVELIYRMKIYYQYPKSYYLLQIGLSLVDLP